jgi:hypothetical protein
MFTRCCSPLAKAGRQRPQPRRHVQSGQQRGGARAGFVFGDAGRQHWFGDEHACRYARNHAQKLAHVAGHVAAQTQHIMRLRAGDRSWPLHRVVIRPSVHLNV